MLLIRLYMLSMNSASSVNCCIMHGPWCIVWFELVFRSFTSRLWKCFIYISGINQFKYEANAALLLCSSLSVFSDLDGFKWKWNAAFHYQIKAFPEVAQISNQIHEKIGQIFLRPVLIPVVSLDLDLKLDLKLTKVNLLYFVLYVKSMNSILNSLLWHSPKEICVLGIIVLQYYTILSFQANWTLSLMEFFHLFYVD